MNQDNGTTAAAKKRSNNEMTNRELMCGAVVSEIPVELGTVMPLRWCYDTFPGMALVPHRRLGALAIQTAHSGSLL